MLDTPLAELIKDGKQVTYNGKQVTYNGYCIMGKVNKKRKTNYPIQTSIRYESDEYSIRRSQRGLDLDRVSSIQECQIGCL